MITVLGGVVNVFDTSILHSISAGIAWFTVSEGSVSHFTVDENLATSQIIIPRIYQRVNLCVNLWVRDMSHMPIVMKLLHRVGFSLVTSFRRNIITFNNCTTNTNTISFIANFMTTERGLGCLPLSNCKVSLLSGGWDNQGQVLIHNRLN